MSTYTICLCILIILVLILVGLYPSIDMQFPFIVYEKVHAQYTNSNMEHGFRSRIDFRRSRVLISDRSPVTAGFRYWYTGPVWPVTGRNRWNSNFTVQLVRTGLPASLAGLPVGLTGNRPNSIFFLFFFNSNAHKVY